MEELKFQTRAIHDLTMTPDQQRSIRYPIYSSVAFDFESAEDLEDAFAGRSLSHSYSRLSNPTVEAFERKIADLEGGLHAIALASGMAAITNTIFSLLRSGDNFITSSFLFGNTYSLFQNTLPGFGLEPRFVDITDLQAIESAIDSNTRLVFLETISNPQMIIPDFEKVSAISQKHGLVLVVDGTLTTPWLFEAKNFGANVVVHSSTKYISGGATSVGGLIVDINTYDWSQNRALKEYHQLNENAFYARLKKEIFRNFGSCMTPQTAYLQNLGLETLSLRVNKSCENATEIANYLNSHSKVVSVRYPGIEGATYNDLAKKQFNGKAGGVLSFELKDRKSCFEFINGLEIVHKATNLNDNHTLVIHPASTIYRDFSEDQRLQMKVPEGLIRLSVGIEDVRDLIDDLARALESLSP